MKPFGWSLGNTRRLDCQNSLISNTPPCAAWRGITDTPVIARCRPRICPLACPLVALGSIDRLRADFGGRSATPPLGLALTPIGHRPVVVVRFSHNNQTGAVTTSIVSMTNHWGSRGDGRQWSHMPSSVLGDAFGQAQDSGIISYPDPRASTRHGTQLWKTCNNQSGRGQPRHPLEGYKGETDHISVYQGCSTGMCCWGVSTIKCVIAQSREVCGEHTGVTKIIEYSKGHAKVTCSSQPPLIVVCHYVC